MVIVPSLAPHAVGLVNVAPLVKDGLAGSDNVTDPVALPVQPD